jgi:hypothetical protein
VSRYVTSRTRRGARDWARHAALALMAALSLAAPLAGQTLRGTVLDSQSGEPVMLAYVGLLGEGRNLVVAGLADTSGDFSILAPAPGSYFLYVARTGYETLMDGVYELGQDGVFEMRVGLKALPVELEPLLVETERDESALETVGFYDRAAIGNGRFIIREDIERTAVERITDAFRGIPNFAVDGTSPLVGRDGMRNPAIVMTRGTSQCNPTLYLDGAMVASGVMGPVRPDDFVVPRDVEAVEVYVRSTETPIEFAAVNDCGVVLVWTRRR